MTSSSTSDSISGFLATQPFVRGCYWPPFCQDWASRLDDLTTFEPRADDVIVISYPKSGHHWSHEFLSMIIKGETTLPKGNFDKPMEAL